jgi:hypothetical protein
MEVDGVIYFENAHFSDQGISEINSPVSTRREHRKNDKKK